MRRSTMSARENWLRLIRNDAPGWIGNPWEPFRGDGLGGIFVTDPISRAAGGPRGAGRFIDGWGVTWMSTPGAPAPTPFITQENKALKDISCWEDQVTFPPLDGLDWTTTDATVSGLDRSDCLVMPFVTGGLFERAHYLMGFEDALMNFYDEPDAMDALLGAIADWKIGQLDRLFDHISPDVIHFHDDWGDKHNVFLPPAVWRRLLKPHQERIVSFVRQHGALFMHHSDTICGPIVEDMADIGIDIWQGAIPQNDIVAIQKQLGGRMAIMGGIDAQVIDMPVADEETIRQEVRRAIDTYVPQGHFIPCIPNIVPIYPEVRRIYEDELVRYGKGIFSLDERMPAIGERHFDKSE